MEYEEVFLFQTNDTAPSLSASFFRLFGLAHASRIRVYQSRGSHHEY